MKKGIIALVTLGLLALSVAVMAFEVKVKVAGDGKNAATYQTVVMAPDPAQTHVASAPVQVAASQVAAQKAAAAK